MSSARAFLKRINRWDLSLIGLVLACALVLFAQQNLAPNDATQVRVKIDGVGTYLLNLSEDQVHTYKTLHGEVTVEIKDGRVRMPHSTCDDQLCVHQGFISEPGSSIVCLPNRVIVECLGTTDYDGVSR